MDWYRGTMIFLTICGAALLVLSALALALVVMVFTL